jgi:ABC-type molybdate transport system substrate-binding protein
MRAAVPRAHRIALHALRRLPPVLALALLAGGCGRTEPARLRVLCGSSMAGPVQEIVREFTERHGIGVDIDLGGSETLLPRVLAGAPADVFVCHDPFEAKVRAAGRRADSVVVGHLRPVLLVKTGNPLSIRTLGDLERAGLRIGIGDPRYSTCGELFVKALEEQGRRDAVMPQVVLQARSPSDAGAGLLVGSLDVAVVWNFTAILYAGKAAMVDPGIPAPGVRVTVIGLRPGVHPEWRDAFLGWCARPESIDLFRRQGYTEFPADAGGGPGISEPGVTEPAARNPTQDPPEPAGHRKGDNTP